MRFSGQEITGTSPGDPSGIAGHTCGVVGHEIFCCVFCLFGASDESPIWRSSQCISPTAIRFKWYGPDTVVLAYWWARTRHARAVSPVGRSSHDCDHNAAHVYIAAFCGDEHVSSAAIRQAQSRASVRVCSTHRHMHLLVSRDICPIAVSRYSVRLCVSKQPATHWLSYSTCKRKRMYEKPSKNLHVERSERRRLSLNCPALDGVRKKVSPIVRPWASPWAIVEVQFR